MDVRERLISGVIALVLVLSAILWGGELAVDIIVGIVVIIGLDEWVRMTAPDAWLRTFTILMGTGCSCYIVLISGASGWAAPVLALSAIEVLCYGLLGLRNTA